MKLKFFRINTKSLFFKFAICSVLAVVLPALTIAASLILIGRRSLTNSIYLDQFQTAQRIADRIEIHLQNIESLAAFAAAEPGLSVFSRERQEESLRRLLRWESTVKEAFLLDAEGREVARLFSENGRFVSAEKLFSRKRKPEFSESMRQGRAVIGQPFFGTDRLPYVLVSCPTYGKRGVLVLRVTLENLWDFVKQVRDGQPGIAYVVDRKGNLLAHPDFERVQMHTNLSTLSIVQAFLKQSVGRESFGLHADERGQTVVALAHEVQPLHWGVIIEIPKRDAYASIRSMQKEVIRWTLLCVLFVLGLVFWRVHKIIKPIAMLEEGARKIAHGQLDLTLNIRTDDELQRLAESFKKMAEALKALEQLRKDLMSMVVHDLNSPLSAVMSGLDYLNQNTSGPVSDKQLKVLNLAKKSAEDLRGLIQNLLDVSKMEEGKLRLRRTLVEPAHLVREAVEPFQIQAQKEAKILEEALEADLPKVEVDVQLIRRVLANLISNALRHTHSDGRIVVHVQRNNEFVEFFVSDNGEGIPLGYQDKIFDKFVQAERKESHLRTGTGLGLTFCKMAVELHHGKISAESSMGRGSTFKFTIPISRALAQTELQFKPETLIVG